MSSKRLTKAMGSGDEGGVAIWRGGDYLRRLARSKRERRSDGLASGGGVDAGFGVGEEAGWSATGLAGSLPMAAAAGASCVPGRRLP